MKELSKDYLKQCQTQEGASEEDLEPFRKKTKPETFKSKCVLACINEKFDFVSASLHYLMRFVSILLDFNNFCIHSIVIRPKTDL